jgi:hypothetical protein
LDRFDFVGGHLHLSHRAARRRCCKREGGEHSGFPPSPLIQVRVAFALNHPWGLLASRSLSLDNRDNIL